MRETRSEESDGEDHRVDIRPLPAMALFERALASFGYRHLCGIDEVGRGPLAGPVVAAAVILPQSHSILGIRDSKQLTPSKRETLSDQIQKQAEGIGIGTVENDIIDEINILNATLLAMEKALHALPVLPDYLLIDALTLSRVEMPQRGIIHGDSLSVSIAAASIVAKVTRDRLMDQYHDEFPEYHFKQHKGYGTADHFDTIKKYGPCRLHRKTFRGVTPVEGQTFHEALA
ncbi:MAG: ribonuclease HII [Nitrospirota bacterium]